MNATTVITDAAGIATAAGVVFGAVQLLLSRTQARTSFEDEVAGQYRQIIKPRITEALLQPLPEEDRQKVQPFYEYFDLSNEQVFLRLQGRVRRKTWVEWAEGIKSNLHRTAIHEAWEIARDRLPEFNELRLLDQVGFRDDPRSWNPLWRRVFRRELPATEIRVARLSAANAPEPRDESS